MSAVKVSIVTTLFNSSAFIDEFVQRATAAAHRITDDYEIVMVDDGSPDTSLQVAIALTAREPRLRVIELSRNFGHHKALMCGMEHATGELVYLIDSDLEEPPEYLEEFHRRMEATGCDVVYGFQEQRKGGLLNRRAGQLAWYFIGKMYSVDAPRNQCTLRLMRREYVKSLLRHREQPPVIGGLFVITGYRQIGVPITKGSRDGSSYNFRLRSRMFLDGLTAFSTVPLSLISYFGLLVSFIAMILGALILFQRTLFGSAAGWASVMVSVWFLGGAIIFCIGVIGIYISNIFLEVKNRPYTIIRQIHQYDHELGAPGMDGPSSARRNM
jgi:putative glycosyltransferase